MFYCISFVCTFHLITSVVEVDRKLAAKCSVTSLHRVLQELPGAMSDDTSHAMTLSTYISVSADPMRF